MVLLDYQILEKLEKLSHLHIDDVKREEILRQLNRILDYVENLNELDTDNLDASFSTLEGGTPMREDVPSGNPDIPRTILNNAPGSKDDFFTVPAIIE